MQKTPFNSTMILCHYQVKCVWSREANTSQHQDKIIDTRGTLLASVMKQLPNFLVAARGNNRFSDSVKTASTD